MAEATTVGDPGLARGNGIDLDTHTYISLASGSGMLDAGVDLGSGGSARPVLYVEWEATAAVVLAARMADGSLQPAPVWSDLGTLDCEPWRGLVDGIVGGYPCQPFSGTGIGRRGDKQRLGHDDPRNLWPSIERLIDAVRPSWCFFENVGAHFRFGYFDVVRPALERRGYVVKEQVIEALDVGAPHARERLFILAVDRSLRLSAGPTCPGTGLDALAHADDDLHARPRAGASGRERLGAGGGDDRRGGGDAGGDARGGVPGERGAEPPEGAYLGRGPGGGRLARPDWPPLPEDDRGWAERLRRLPEGLPVSQYVSRGDTNGVAGGLGLRREDVFRIVGNGVVPQQAALAWNLLWHAFTFDREV